MKNLHKKIGAMVLAGMVVLGGVAACGVNSFAASGSKVNKVEVSKEDPQVRKVMFACKLLDAKVIDYEKVKVRVNRSAGNKSRVYKVDNDKLELSLYNLRKKGNVKIEYRGIRFSIKFNK